MPGNGHLPDEEENRRIVAQERPVEEWARGEFRARSVAASDIVPERIAWLWYPYLPRGKIALLGGDPGLGKTWVALSMAAANSQGFWPFALAGPASSTEPGTTLFFACEDGLADTLVPRLSLLHADLTRIRFVLDKRDRTGKTDRINLNDESVIVRHIQDHQARLAIFDPFQGFLPSGTKMNHMETVRPVVSALVRAAEATQCCIILIGHLNKSRQESAAYKFMGSIDWLANARSAMMIVHDAKNQQRLFYQVKNSLAPMPPGIGFSFDGDSASLRWGQSVESAVEDILSGHPAASRTAAVDFLRAFLAEGPKTSNQVQEESKDIGIAWRTLQDAKKDANVKSLPKNGVWFMMLPQFVDAFRENRSLDQ